MNKKKQREKDILNSLIKVFPGFPQGHIEESEAPDFLVHSTTGIIGIELHDYIRMQGVTGSKQRERESLRDSVINKARQSFEKNYQKPLYVLFSWQHDSPIENIIRDNLVTSIVKLVSQKYPKNTYETIKIEWEDFQDKSLEQMFNIIRIHTNESLTKNCWVCSEADWIGMDYKKEIEPLINNKEAKIKSYLTKCTKVWLVIVFSGEHISSTVDTEDIERASKDLLLESQFEKIILYERFINKVFSLK